MSFNPISIDDDTVLLDGLSNHSATTTTTAAASPQAAASGAEGLFTSTTPVSQALRLCQQCFYFDLGWSVPFPRAPAGPLLYYPTEYTELLRKPDAISVMQSELDAMVLGVTEQIPLAYYPLKPGVIAETRAAAQRTEQRTTELRNQARAAGQLDRLNWRPEEVNPALCEADARLLNTDVDGDVVLRRDLPSLTLLQRPLYTDMGLVPQEERHSARLARIVPNELRQMSQGAGLPGSPLAPSSPIGGSAGAALVNVASSAFETAAEAEGKQQAWVSEVRRSFRHAKALESTFEGLLGDMVDAKLGLDRNNGEHRELGRALWRQLLEDVPPACQHGVWHVLCHFSFNYDPSDPLAAGRQLRKALADRRVPNFPTIWRPLADRYVETVDQYVASLKGGVAERKTRLRFSDLELDPQYVGGFAPELVVSGELRRLGKELGSNRARLPVFPLEVIPVFPTSFGRAAKEGVSAAKSAEGLQDYLAESADALHHVELPGAKIPADAAGGPHVLVGDTNLLVADTPSTMADVQAGATVSYHTSVQHAFGPLYHDENNTSSYLMRVHSTRAGGEGGRDARRPISSAAAAAANPSGLTDEEETELNGALSKEGRYVTYDRVGWRDVYAKASNVRAPPFSRHVLLFDDGTITATHADSRKRARDTGVDTNGGPATGCVEGDDEASARRVFKTELQ